MYESHPGGLEGLVVGEVLETTPHPNADKLKVTKVNVGASAPLQIVCGAANVAPGQRVVVARVGTTIYPTKRQPVTMKTAVIRGVESQGMICAEDEIGISEDHSGILVLPGELKPGTMASDYFEPFTDWIYEIGLTPNRMDAMSHLGVARDVCAYLSHQDGKKHLVKTPFRDDLTVDNVTFPIDVTIENTDACQRYSGVTLTNVTVSESPKWLQQKLRSIGQRPINNIVDITNFVLHETGQPLHAFDADHIQNRQIIVENLPESTVFQTLDERERKLSNKDLMICNGAHEGMCIAGVFGGMRSGVKASTKNIFLESAWFNPVDIRKTSFRHGLRTDAAMHFEKNVDISNTVAVLKRAATLIKEIAGGLIASEIIDVYPNPKPRQHVSLKYAYLNKLSGKSYGVDTTKKMLEALGFDIVSEDSFQLTVAVPYHKSDVSLPADLVEEIMRIDGYDNIAIPTSINISPAVESGGRNHAFKEKVSNFLVASGFYEIFTNSITNAAYFEDADLASGVSLMNNLSAVHNIMRPSMLETGLEAVAYNLNRKNSNLRFFEFGKTYRRNQPGQYQEKEHLCIYISGAKQQDSWRTKRQAADIYYLKGVVNTILQLTGVANSNWTEGEDNKFENTLQIVVDNHPLITVGTVRKNELNRFDIKQPVFFASIDWDEIKSRHGKKAIRQTELPKQLPVFRDLAMIVPKALPYGSVETALKGLQLDRLKEIKLFDIFESERLGIDKKSMAISLTFLDEEKTMTDSEIDAMMKKLMNKLETDLHAEIRK